MKKFMFECTVRFEVDTTDVNASLGYFQDMPIGVLIDSDKDIKVTRLGFKDE